MTEEHQIIMREKALEMALRYHVSKDTAPTDIVETAKTFAAYLTTTPEA